MTDTWNPADWTCIDYNQPSGPDLVEQLDQATRSWFGISIIATERIAPHAAAFVEIPTEPTATTESVE